MKTRQYYGIILQNLAANKIRCFATILAFAFCFAFTSAIASDVMANDLASASQQQKQVTGTIFEPDGKTPAIGVKVQIKGTQIGTATDVNGSFIIRVPQDPSTLVISQIGHKTLEIEVKSGEQLNVTLEESATALDEVVVVAYGSQKRTAMVSSVNTVTSKELRMPTGNLTNNLAGQVAGLFAVQRSGEPGYDDAEFWIRGVSSFAGGTSPLVLVDGIPRKMSDIEADEIETFSVLKDAAATAVYGAEGANGVILITSKRGKVEKATISFRTDHSFSQPTRLPKFMGAADYLDLYNEAYRNDTEENFFTDEYIAKYRNTGPDRDYDLNPDVDWMNIMLKDWTDNHRYSVNFKGGTEKARYFVSASYFNETGIFKNVSENKLYKTDIGINRFNLRSNIDLEVSRTTTLSVDMAGVLELNQYPGKGSADIFRQMLLAPGYLFPHIYSDGTISTYEIEADSNTRNPYNYLAHSGYTKEFKTQLQTKLTLDQKLDFITQGLSVRGTMAYDYYGNMFMKRTWDPTRYFAKGRDPETGALIFSKTYSGQEQIQNGAMSSDANSMLYLEVGINYARTFGEKHDVTALLLYNQRETRYHSTALPYRKQSYVGRATYGYDSRYMIDINFGVTGSENFAKGYRYGLFPAVGVAYYVSNEKFYPEALKKVVNKLKLRATVGRTGNDQTGGSRFLYMGSFGNSGYNYQQSLGTTEGLGDNKIQYGSGLVEGRVNAPYLSWEIDDKTNIGVDLGLFNDRIDITVDYFKSERSGILLTRRTVPQVSGFRQDPWTNFGKVNNEGFDGVLSLSNNFGELKASIRGTATFAKNIILEYDELPQKYGYQSVTGRAINTPMIYQADGLFTHEEFDITVGDDGKKIYTLKDKKYNTTMGVAPKPGDIKYKDLNGDNIINQDDQSRDLIKGSAPEFMYGFGLSLDYKGFYLNAFFQGATGCDIMLPGNESQNWFPFTWEVWRSNARTFLADRWTEENPRQDVLMPRMHQNGSYNRNNTASSTWWSRKGDFLRFKSLEIGYSFPKAMLSKIGFKSARVYLMGYNLAVWDEIGYFDPEQGSKNAGFDYPLPRTFTIGVDFTF